MQPGRASRYKASCARRSGATPHEPEINFLNITAMLDMMTIILVFLLKSLGESSTAIPQSDDLQLADVGRSAREPPQEGVVGHRSRSRRSWSATRRCSTLPGRESLAQTGVDAKYKRSGPNDLYIVPLGNALQSARKTDAAHPPGQGPRSVELGSDRHRRHDARPIASSSRCSSRSGRASSASTT